MSNDLVLAIDQGTSGTKAILFDAFGQIVSKGFTPLSSSFPQPEFVEQDPFEIYQTVLAATKDCLDGFSKDPEDLSRIKCCGLSNQRETFVLWDDNGKPLHPAVVWQCKRSVDICNRLIGSDLEQLIEQNTGLLIDPYFSGTKVLSLKENNSKVSESISNGTTRFGNIDTWLVYCLTNGAEYATDYTNASRTMFFNLNELAWDQNILAKMQLQNLSLPALRPSSSLYGFTDFGGILPSAIPIAGVIGDSHAAAFGEGCFKTGDAKATLGTGSSVLMNIGASPASSTAGMVTTLCWALEDRTDYALEGIIVSCGSTLKWLGNNLGIFEDVSDTEDMAQSLEGNDGVYLIPAFSGMGAPHWKMDAKASIQGLTLATEKRHIVRAGLESVCFQLKDVLDAMAKDSGTPVTTLRVDGGLSKNKFAMQYLANVLATEVVSVGFEDVSALGAAYLAGLNQNIYAGLDQLEGLNKIENRFKPDHNQQKTAEDYRQWQQVLNRSL